MLPMFSVEKESNNWAIIIVNIASPWEGEKNDKYQSLKRLRNWKTMGNETSGSIPVSC